MKKEYLISESKKVVQLFRNRFGEKHIIRIINKLEGVNISVRDNPYDIWLGTVTENGTVLINTMNSNKNVEETITHELLHKVNNIKDENSTEISCFELCPEEYKKYIRHV